MVAVAFDDSGAIASPELADPLAEILFVNPVLDEKLLNRRGDVTPRDVASRFSSL